MSRLFDRGRSKIFKFDLGQQRCPLLIAEIGGNHEGDFGYAKELVWMAIESAADVVKLQIYSGDDLVSKIESPERNQHFKKFELSIEQHIEIAEMVSKSRKIYSASVWDCQALQLVDDYLEFYKIGSGDLTFFPMLDLCAASGKPMLVSTGLAEIGEVASAIKQIRSVNNVYFDPAYLCLMQCTSMYPIPLDEAHVKVLESYRSYFQVATGYSDHTVGTTALEVAAALGASVLEFHFTDKPDGRVFRDHRVSLTGEDVDALKVKLTEIRMVKGGAQKEPQPSEIANGHISSFRRGVYLKRLVRAGEKISSDDLVYLRPAHGTDARKYKQLIGAIAIRDIEPLNALVEEVDYKPVSRHL